MILKRILLWILKFYDFFLIVDLDLNKGLGFNIRVCIFFYCLDWELVFFLTISFVTSIFSPDRGKSLCKS